MLNIGPIPRQQTVSGSLCSESLSGGTDMGSSVSLSDIRVTVLSSVTPRKAMAGPAIRALNLALQLRDFGYTVTLAAPDRPDIDIPIRTVPLAK